MRQGKVSSKYQLTLPVNVRKALGIKAGDTVRYELEGNSVRVSVIRPDIDQVLDSVLDEFNFDALRQETQDDAVSFYRRHRGLDD